MCMCEWVCGYGVVCDSVCVRVYVCVSVCGGWVGWCGWCGEVVVWCGVVCRMSVCVSTCEWVAWCGVCACKECYRLNVHAWCVCAPVHAFIHMWLVYQTLH